MSLQIFVAGATAKVQNTNSRVKSQADGDLPVPGAGFKPPRVVRERSSSPAREPTLKRHNGKQKETSRDILEEVLNNFEDEMVCPMSGSLRHLHHSRALTFMILDAVTFCKRQRVCIMDPTDMNHHTALMPIWVTLVGILSAENVGGAGSRKT